MKRSTDRILTTHVGSLPRPSDLLELIRARTMGEPYDQNELANRLREAVAESVRWQAEAGVDVVDDGELGKPQFADYVAERIAGFEGTNTEPPFAGEPMWRHQSELLPEYTAWRRSQQPMGGMTFSRQPKCIGPLNWKDRGYLVDIANLRTALEGVDVEEAFIPSPSPGIIARRIPNAYYATTEEYLYAIADVMREEYRAIVEAGFVLQIDAPDAAMGGYQSGEALEWFRSVSVPRVDALNHALQGIPEDRIRYHTCWGNISGPHIADIELKDIIDLVLRVNAQAYSIEAANPRHAHESTLWEQIRLPEGKILIPGVIDSVSEFVEHPDLVTQRIVQYTRTVGRENVIAGTDCGFGTFAGMSPIHPEIVRAKFRSLAEGARRASAALWAKVPVEA
jgi:5-methyltetrahydropteroyltriglutamate--homocysteine methyltransferase